MTEFAAAVVCFATVVLIGLAYLSAADECWSHGEAFVNITIQGTMCKRADGSAVLR